MNAAKKDPHEGYRTLVDGQPVYIHPSSSLFQRQPEYCIYHQVVLTSKEYMRAVLTIEPKWLLQVAERFYKPANAAQVSSRRKNETINPLFDRRDEGDAWRLSKRRGR